MVLCAHLLYIQNKFIKVKLQGFKRIENSKNVKFNSKLLYRILGTSRSWYKSSTGVEVQRVILWGRRVTRLCMRAAVSAGGLNASCGGAEVVTGRGFGCRECSLCVWSFGRATMRRKSLVIKGPLSVGLCLRPGDHPWLQVRGRLVILFLELVIFISC